MTVQLICNRFGGIRKKSASFAQDLISASELQNVELYDTGINGGVGIRTTKGNIAITEKVPADEKIINIFETVQKQETYHIVHTISDTEGKLYVYSKNTDTLSFKKGNLALARQSSGLDFAQGYSDLFVFTNGTNFFTLEIGATTETVEINAVDTLGRPVKGLALASFNGRLWLADGNILRYSVQNDIRDWSTSDIDVITSAGHIEYTKPITAIYEYLKSLAVFSQNSSVQISGNYPFSQDEDSPGGCAGYDSLVFHDTELYFLDYTKKGIFKFEQVVNGQRTLGKNIAVEIQDELQKIDSKRLNEIRTLSVILEDRNEIWWILPTSDANYSTILIYDYLKGEWIKRKSQKINCARIVDNILYSGSETGKLLQEYKTNTFDGEYIGHYYYCSPLNLGSNTTQKSLYFPPRVAFDLPFSNNFFVKYIKNFDVFQAPKIKEIIANYKNFLIWGIGYWGINYWATKTTNSIGKFPTATFKILEIQLYTENKNQNFAIKNIEFSQIEVMQV